jgi:anthranilate phosphoribosyltransferase
MVSGLRTISLWSKSLKSSQLRLRTPHTKTSLQASMKPLLTKLINGEDLTTEETESAWDTILEGGDEAVVGALLTLLRAKGETPKEIAGMVNAMKKACNAVILDGPLLDIVGTGGDGADTINISTAAAILSAAAGARVCKAGNRSVSSQCGSADVLEKVGVNIELSPEQVAKSVEQTGIGFMYAPVNHPAMKAVAPIRKSLGVRTAFNLLGPMTNAAGAQHVVIGVFHEELVELMANSLMEVGNIEHGVVVHGCGLDEISPLGKSSVLEIKNLAKKGEPKEYDIKSYDLDPLTLGVPRCTVEDLKGGDRDRNAQEMRDVLSAGDHTNSKRDSVVLNAGMGLYVYDVCTHSYSSPSSSLSSIIIIITNHSSLSMTVLTSLLFFYIHLSFILLLSSFTLPGCGLHRRRHKGS